jgi:hypothetical protein
MGQNRNHLMFVDYTSAIAEIKKNPGNKKIKDKYDYVNILLLDSSELNTIKRIDPNIIDEFREYSYGLKLKRNFKNLKIEGTNIKKLFVDSINQRQILKLLQPEIRIEDMKIDSPIYIKQNKAIFDISGKIWTATYFAKIENNKLKMLKLCETERIGSNLDIENKD